MMKNMFNLSPKWGLSPYFDKDLLKEFLNQTLTEPADYDVAKNKWTIRL